MMPSRTWNLNSTCKFSVPRSRLKSRSLPWKNSSDIWFSAFSVRRFIFSSKSLTTVCFGRLKATHHARFSLFSFSFLINRCQYLCVSPTIFVANSLFLGCPLKANSFSGFPVGTLYNLNHSCVA